MSRVNAFPTKRFFVEMLVRDIELKDALLDLLDNCVDGAMRARKAQGLPLDAPRPYEGFWAKIAFSADEFSIEDNCGGIPPDVAEHSAFRLGRPSDAPLDEDLPTVGVYGIGMKRAIFKIGRRALVSSRHGDDAFDVEISPEWMDNDVWNLELVPRGPLPGEPKGTHLIVNEIRDGVSTEFEQKSFFDSFYDAVSQYYGVIIQKGFKVFVGSELVEPKQIGFVIDLENLNEAQAFAPYVYHKTADEDGVDVTLAVGFYRPFQTEGQEYRQEEEEREGKPTSELAGWTVIINDRVVLYADKTRVTGWDEAGVPAYHTQFTSIAGIVSFRSRSPESLPLTTTKRGVNGNSDLYLEVKNHMRDGLKVFTNFTNVWKKAPEQREQLRSNVGVSTTEEAIAAVRSKMRVSRRDNTATFFVPSLPTPTTESKDGWIRFKKPLSDIGILGKYFFDDVAVPPSVIGEKAFDESLQIAKAKDGSQ